MKRLLAALLLVVTALPVNAAEIGSVFEKGRTSFSIMAGSGYAFDNSYVVIGVSATYYVIDGLGVGLAYENWSGGTPTMTKYSPFVQYVFPRVASMYPYVGAFYRQSNFSTLPSVDSTGARAGVYYSVSSNAYVGLGMVYESYLDCSNTVYNSCSSTYPDISLTFAF